MSIRPEDFKPKNPELPEFLYAVPTGHAPLLSVTTVDCHIHKLRVVKRTERGWRAIRLKWDIHNTHATVFLDAKYDFFATPEEAYQDVLGKYQAAREEALRQVAVADQMIASISEVLQS